MGGASDAAGYSRAWRRLHRLWMAQTFLWILFVPVVILSAALQHLTGSRALAIAVGSVWIAAIAITSFRGASFRCPRCARRFFIKGLRSKSPFRRESERVCAHCGLQVGS